MKKLFKIIIIILAAAALASGAFYVFTNLKEQKETSTVRETLSQSDYQNDPQSGYARLNDNEKEAYAMFVEAAEAFNSNVSLSRVELSIDSVERTASAFIKDNPQYFWIDNVAYQYNTSNIVTDVTFNYNCTEDVRDSRQQVIDQKTAEIQSQIPSGADDYTIVKTVHDAIVLNTSYASGDNDQNMSSVFVEGKSVCAGYSRAFEYILKKCGIFCCTVDGQASGRGDHEWNIVKMDGNYYFVDVTWDDPSFSDNSTDNIVEHTYLGITTTDLQTNHVINDRLGGVAECTSMDDNYYVREGRYFSSSDLGDFISGLQQAVTAGNSSYDARFSDPGYVETAINYAANGSVRGLQHFKYTVNDQLGTVNIIFQ